MNKTLIAVLGLAGTFAVGLLLIVFMWMNYSNSEVRLRNAIVAKQKDNQNEMDAMWKNISQTAQVADKDRQSLMQIFNGYAQARSGEGDNQAIFKWIKESVPNVDTKTFQNLQNIIVSQRDGFKFRQKELLDLNREHDNIIDTYPSHLFVGGRGKIDVVIVTSTRTDNAFKTGKDDDTKLFQDAK
jgi:beta-lactam-binding protein with PASTA domain